MKALATLIILFSLLPGLTGCEQPQRPKTVLEEVIDSGELVVISRVGSTTYYEGPDGKPTGFEYELISRFADYLGVKPKIIVPPFFGDIIPMIARSDAHLAAAGLTITAPRKELVRFGPAYQHITQQVVYRRGNGKPGDIAALAEGDLEVLAGTSHAERLTKLSQDHPELTWRESHDMEVEELLTFVWNEMIDYTIADSNDIALSQRFYPELRVAFDISEPEPLGWAFPKSDDYSLYNKSLAFFSELLNNGELEQLIERYYGHTEQFDYVGTRKFISHYYQRLPKFQTLFEQAASENNLDWRLLAAMGYQESHWNPKAISPTGVRGIMMLTRNTARQLGIENRIDPENSIRGGAEYFTYLKGRMSDRIPEPDRTWMAVAAYNVGMGHLQDARIITERRGYDPDKWIYVKESLPLLRKKSWYKKTKHGYARGHEPVIYVQNIRNYYDLIVRIEEEETGPPEKTDQKPAANFQHVPGAI